MPPGAELYRALFSLVYEDARAPAVRLSEAVDRIHRAHPRHQWTGIYLLRDGVLELGPHVGPATEHHRIPVGTGLCGRAVAEARDLDVGDVHQASGYLACSLTTKAEAIALLWYKGHIIGQIDIDSDTAGEFGAAAMATLSHIAHLLAPLAAEVRE